MIRPSFSMIGPYVAVTGLYFDMIGPHCVIISAYFSMTGSTLQVKGDKAGSPNAVTHAEPTSLS